MKGKGFTVIELLIVITIISILVSIAIPIFTKNRLLAKLEKGGVLSDEEQKRYNDNKEEWDKLLKKYNTVEKKVEVEKEEEKPVVKKDAVVETSTTQTTPVAGSIPPIPPIN